jgi:hypothetical protein
MCSNFAFVGPSGRLPGGLLTTLPKKYWLGLYKVGDDGRQKLALKWGDYEAAKLASHGTDERVVPTCAQVVISTFWVRLLFKDTSQDFVEFSSWFITPRC